MKRPKPALYQVYFAQPGGRRTQAIKVGITTQNLYDRLQSIPRKDRKSNYIFRPLYAFMTWNRNDEQVIHWMLRRYHVKGRGREWFRVGEGTLHRILRRWMRDMIRIREKYRVRRYLKGEK